jgi:hypothetical protein
MPDERRASPVHVLDQALRDSDTPGRTRRWLLERAAIGAVGAAAGATLAPGGGRFYQLAHPPMKPPLPIGANKPS